MIKIAAKRDLDNSDIERLSKCKYVALDTETTGLNPNRDLLCLVQLCDESGQITILRTREWSSCSGLREFLKLQNVIKVIHYALFDCSFLQHNLGCEVANIYCTRTASKLARTYSGHHSLGDIVFELLGVKLDKSQQSTFWCSDKLTKEQLIYACMDVRYLIAVRQKLEEILEAKGCLPSGISFLDLNKRCQEVIPTLVQLRLNGWEADRDQPGWIF